MNIFFHLDVEYSVLGRASRPLRIPRQEQRHVDGPWRRH